MSINKHNISEKEILEKLLSNGALSAYEISLIMYSDRSDVEDKLEKLQQKKLIKKLLEIEGEQFYSLSFKGMRNLKNLLIITRAREKILRKLELIP